MKRLATTHVLAAGARWLAWLLAIALLWNRGSFTSPAADVRPWLWIGYITLYMILWTRVLPRLMQRALDGSPLILYDLVLSLLPVWFSGGWTSPLFVFALSVLVMPTLVRGSRGGLPVALGFLICDQLILWTTTPNPWQISIQGWQASLELVGRTVLPFGMVFGLVGLIALQRRFSPHQQRQRAVTQVTRQQEFPSVQVMLESAGVDTGTSYSRDPGDAQPARSWSKDRATPQTIERRQPASIQAALQHLVPELQAANVELNIHIEGDERYIPPQVHDLLTRATEIALDNIILHAHARTADVSLRIMRDAALLSVGDDGIGLFDGTAEPPGFHQLKRMRFRAQELGGVLHVEEREEGGVVLSLQVPLHH